MDDSLLRLAWALPLVLLIGVVLIHGLKRLGLGQPGPAAVSTPTVVSETSLSEHTRVFVLEHQRRQYLVVESSAASVSVQPLPAAGSGASASSTSLVSQAWLRGKREA